MFVYYRIPLKLKIYKLFQLNTIIIGLPVKPRTEWECVICFCLKELKPEFLGLEKNRTGIYCYSHKDSSRSRSLLQAEPQR